MRRGWVGEAVEPPLEVLFEVTRGGMREERTGTTDGQHGFQYGEVGSSEGKSERSVDEFPMKGGHLVECVGPTCQPSLDDQDVFCCLAGRESDRPLIEVP